MKAMIFAAGFGKRLLPLTKSIPKPLIQVQEKSVLDWIIERLQSYGIREIIINTHHLANKIMEHLVSRYPTLSISFSHEDTILGTGGGLYQTINYWDQSDFYLCNADILCTADLKTLFQFHSKQQALATLAVNHRVSDSMLLIDGNGMFVGVRKNGKDVVKTIVQGEIRPVGFCGMQVISPAIFTYFRPPVAFSIIDEYLKVLASGGKIATWDIGSAFWVDTGSFHGLENARRHFPGFI